MDSIQFSEFSAIGVNISDTFDIWRKKTNGIVDELVDIRNDISPLFYSTGQNASALLRTVTLDTPQIISGAKTFAGGSASAPILKIGAVGLYETDGVLSTTTPIQVDKLILQSQLQFGEHAYNIPNNNPSEASILGKSGNVLSWTTLNSIISQIQSEGAATVVSTNEILPVGSLVDYAPDGATISSDWLRCTGSRFKGLDYPQLATILLNKYAPIYTSQNGNVIAPSVSYNANWWYTLPNISGAIIKAKPDSVVNTFIDRGNVFDIIRNSESIQSLSLSTGGTAILNLRHDPTLTVNANRQLGIAPLAITADKLANNVVDPSKLSLGGPSWDSTSAALFEGNDPNTRRRVATREYVDELVFKKGPAARLVTKPSHSPYTSAPSFGEFCYINHDGVPIITGNNTSNRFGFADKYSHCEMPLPDNRKAAELYVGYNYMCVLDTIGELWVVGNITHNLFNIVPFPAAANTLAVVKTWTKAFTPLYTYQGNSNNKIKKVILSGDIHINNVAVIDSANRLWIAGYNQYGILGRGNRGTTTTSTATKAAGEATPVIDNAEVYDACIVGSWDGTNENATCIALTSTGIRVAGYGSGGLRGDGLAPSAINTTFNNVTIPGVTDYSSCKLYAGGEDTATTAFLTTDSENVVYGWGYNANGILGDNTTSNKNRPTLVWENPDLNIDKIYTTTHVKNQGAAYIFGSKNNAIAKLGSDITTTGTGDLLGTSIACSDSGNIVAIGSPNPTVGKVVCYQYSGTSWVSYGSALNGTEGLSNFGKSVSLNSAGTRLVVGIPDGQRVNNNVFGQVRVYSYSNNNWSQLGVNLNGILNASKFGSSVALSGNGNAFVVGAPNSSRTINGSTFTNVGRVFAYSITGTSIQQLGTPIDGLFANQNCGSSVAINTDGTIIAVTSNGSTNAGVVRIYQLRFGQWSQLGQDLAGSSANDNFGAVSLNGAGTRIAIGAPGNDTNGSNSGQTRVFQYNSITTTWEQLGNTISGASVDSLSGTSVSLSRDGQTLAIGVPNADTLGRNDNGYIRLYRLTNNNWKLMSASISGENSNEKFGTTVALSGDGNTVFGGAPTYNTNRGLVRSLKFVSQPTTINELWCSGTNTGNKFGISGNSNQWRLAGQLPSGYEIQEFWCGNGYYSDNVNFAKAWCRGDDNYYLFAVGANGQYQSGNGSNTPLNVWTRLNISSDIVQRIVDVQCVSPYGSEDYTVLLLNDGSLYFSGYNAYMIDPNLPNNTYRTDFTRIK
jgi:hypothetical protein